MRLLALLAPIVLAAACAPLPATRGGPYVGGSFEELPGWRSAGLAPSLRAFLAGCPRAPQALREPCAAALEVQPGEERAFFEARFVPYALVAPDGGERGLVTGYYEPVLRASRAPDERYRYPILGVPEDLVVVDLAAVNPQLRHLRLRGRLEGRRLVPYYSREEIASGIDGFSAPAIAWTDDPLELFFLQVQGSGQLVLESGERLRVGYADHNGHPYRSIGRHLVKAGELSLEAASMQGIKAWAAANPDKLRAVLNHNAAYVFFRALPPGPGPIGALGVPLSAGYSLAVDRRHIPLGAPVYLAAAHPLTGEPLERLMAAQDTGGAIRGAPRADFFWGTGDEAGAAAGLMREQGRLWLLWPRGAPLPPAG